MNENTSAPTTPDFPQHSLGKSLGLHVLPGVLTTAAFVIFKPLLDPIGVHHGVVVFATLYILKALPELVEGIEHLARHTEKETAKQHLEGTEDKGLPATHRPGRPGYGSVRRGIGRGWLMVLIRNAGPRRTRAGTGTGCSAHSYGNTSPTDYGVNQDASGNLSGHAWGTAVGWINFDPDGAEGVAIDPVTGDFGGYAWGENIGRLSFSGSGSVAYKATELFRECYLPMAMRGS